MRKLYVATLPVKSVFFLFAFLLFGFLANAAAISSTAAGGNWNATTSWVGGVVPGTGDDVTIVSTATVTVNVASNAKSVVVDGTLNVNANLVIANKGAVTVNTNANLTFNATATISGGGGGSNAVDFTLNAGGNLTTANAAGITAAGNTTTGSIIVNGTKTYSTSANYAYNGVALQVTGNGLPATVNTLTINNAVGVNLTSAVAVTTSLTIGSLIPNSIFNDNGRQVTSTGTLNLTSGTFHIGSGATATSYPGFTTNNIAAGTTVNYASTAAQTIVAVNYGNVTNTGNGPRTLASSGTIGIKNSFTPSTGAN
ncbi:MAG: hypothetical protein EOP51_33080, partial [Sphingobacteriales bacterium]